MKNIATILLVLFSLSVAINTASAAISISPEFSLIGDNDNDGSKVVKTSNSNTDVFEVIPYDGNEKLTVKFNLDANVSSVKMIDNQSTIVFEGAKTRGGANNVLDIPIEDMEAGTYFIRVQTDEGISVERIIISK